MEVGGVLKHQITNTLEGSTNHPWKTPFVLYRGVVSPNLLDVFCVCVAVTRESSRPLPSLARFCASFVPPNPVPASTRANNKSALLCSIERRNATVCTLAPTLHNVGGILGVGRGIEELSSPSVGSFSLPKIERAVIEQFTFTFVCPTNPSFCVSLQSDIKRIRAYIIMYKA